MKQREETPQRTATRVAAKQRLRLVTVGSEEVNALPCACRTRRRFIQSTFVLGAAGLWRPEWMRAAAPPTSNPTRALQLGWTDTLNWDLVVDLTTVTGAGEFWDERLEQAQQRVAAKGGGVVFFPAGSYRFRDDIRLRTGVILRGAEPDAGVTARDETFSPPAKLEFPKYTPVFTGRGAPVDGAFKGILLAEPATAAHCGVVHLALNRGHITLGEAEGHRCGANRLVFGCSLRNSTVNNTTRSNGIRVMGWPAAQVVVRQNRHLGAKPGRILNEAEAELAHNTNYEVSAPPRKV